MHRRKWHASTYEASRMLRAYLCYFTNFWKFQNCQLHIFPDVFIGRENCSVAKNLKQPILCLLFQKKLDLNCLGLGSIHWQEFESLHGLPSTSMNSCFLLWDSRAFLSICCFNIVVSQRILFCSIWLWSMIVLCGSVRGFLVRISSKLIPPCSSDFSLRVSILLMRVFGFVDDLRQCMLFVGFLCLSFWCRSMCLWHVPSCTRRGLLKLLGNGSVR